MMWSWTVFQCYLDGLCKKNVTPLLTHWCYVFLAWTHQSILDKMVSFLVETHCLWTNVPDLFLGISAIVSKLRSSDDFNINVYIIILYMCEFLLRVAINSPHCLLFMVTVRLPARNQTEPQNDIPHLGGLGIFTADVGIPQHAMKFLWHPSVVFVIKHEVWWSEKHGKIA